MNTPNSILKLAYVGVLYLTLFGSHLAHASDHTNLEGGLPTAVEDAYPTAYRNRELQFQGRYERTSDGKNQYILNPRLELGFARNWQARIAVPFRLGGGDRTGSGDLGLEAFYNFNNESLKLPAFAVSAQASLPTGNNSSGIDTEFKFIASKYLGKGSNLQRMHLNLIYRNNAKAQAGERSGLFSGILGYSQRLNADTIGIMDFVHEQSRQDGETSNVLELGLRRQLTPLSVLSLGVGAGVSKNSPDLRLTVGLQHSF